MSSSNKDGLYQKLTDFIKKFKLPLILASAAFVLIAITAVWVLLAQQKTPLPELPDTTTAQQDTTHSGNTTSVFSTGTELTSSLSADGTSSPPSEETKATVEPTESEQPTETETPTQPQSTTTNKQTETAATTQTHKPAETEKPTPLPSSPDAAAQLLLDRMTLEEKVYQLFIVTPEQLCGVTSTVTQAGSAAQTALQSRPVGGVIFFAANIQTPNQTTQLIANLQAYSRLGLFIAVDEEGGTVARLGKNPNMGTTVFPPMGEIGASGDTNNAYNAGLTIGQDIRRFGFNLDFAPIADVNSNPNNPVIKERSFSSDPLIAAEMVAACVAGFKKSGVLCTLKHFPGHGDTSTDSHYGSASSLKTLEELQACEFLPFKSGIAAGADVVMLGHISLPNVTGNDIPATLSYEITTGILREQLGFDGLIVTDAMSMAAITSRFSSGAAAVQALNAGADIILMPENLADAVNGILNAVKTGELSEKRLNESVYRILYTKLTHGIIPLG